MPALGGAARGHVRAKRNPLIDLGIEWVDYKGRSRAETMSHQVRVANAMIRWQSIDGQK